MSTALTQIKPSAMTSELIGLYAEVQHPSHAVKGGISDVQQTKVLDHRREKVLGFTRLYIGGQCLFLTDDLCQVLIAGPHDPCDGEPLPASADTAPAGSTQPATTAPSRPRRRAPGHWVTVVGSATLLGFGTSLALASAPLTAGTFAGMALIALGGAALTRVLHLAGALR